MFEFLNFLSDSDLTDECTEHCLTERLNCVGTCMGDSSCLYDCDIVLGNCIYRCPCQIGCPLGCAGCESSFCNCRYPESNSDYLECQEKSLYLPKNIMLYKKEQNLTYSRLIT